MEPFRTLTEWASNPDNWCQKNAFESGGVRVWFLSMRRIGPLDRCCISGAIMLLAEGRPTYPAKAVWRQLQARVGDDVPAWNDDPKRQQADILVVVREVEDELGLLQEDGCVE